MCSSSSAADEPEILPELPPELIVVVLTHLPIRAMGTASLVCRAYCTAAKVDDVWKSLLQRRWALGSLDAFGARFGSWRALFHALRQLKPSLLHSVSSSSAALRDGALISVHGLEPPACRFLVGVAMGGLFPTADGLFTHHEEGTSPIHYRHSLSAAEWAALDEHDASRVRLGGFWEWSCDRTEWFPCSTASITRGLFSATFGEWELSESNLEIVGYLHDWPVVPLVLRECALTPNTDAIDDAFWRTAHADVRQANEQQVAALGVAICSEEPTTPCVELRAITTHFFLQPARHLRPQAWAWEAVYLSAAQQSAVCESAEELCGAEVLNQYGPNMAPHGLSSLKPYTWAYLCELRMRGELGIWTEEEGREYTFTMQDLNLLFQ